MAFQQFRPRLILVAMYAAALCLGCAAGALAADDVRTFLKKPDAWFSSDEGRRVAANVLSFQTPAGDWPKNTNTAAAPYQGDRSKLKGTFDNRATTDELRFLARAYAATKDDAYRAAFEKGLDHILEAQYPNGGWPQSYPPGGGFARHITFNDDCMVRLMEFVRQTAAGDQFAQHAQYAFVDRSRRVKAQQAFDRGVACILKCQVKVEGTLTVWCAQHDERDFSPRPARTYELASLSGCESAGIVRLLMSLEHPSPEVVTAVDHVVVWFKNAKLTGIRQVVIADDKSPTGKNKVVIEDTQAPPMWARFYEIGTNRPLFVDRDGVPQHNLADIGYERRNGYAWLGNWPQALLDNDYPRWKEKHASAD